MIDWSVIDLKINNIIKKSIDTKNLKIICTAGCSTCCRIEKVYITIPEAIRITKYLNNLENNLKEIIKIQLNISHNTIKKFIDINTKQFEMQKYNSYNHTHHCPFLVNDVCSIYEVRPIACRVYISEDIKKCINRNGFSIDDEEIPSISIFLHNSFAKEQKLPNKCIMAKNLLEASIIYVENKKIFFINTTHFIFYALKK